MTISRGMKSLVWILCLLTFAVIGSCRHAAAQTSSSKTPNSQEGFTAFFERDNIRISLEFTRPPDFLLNMDNNISNKGRARVYSTQDSAGKKYKYVKRRNMSEDGNKCLLYEYVDVKKPSAKLYIWTNIENVSADNLNFMKINSVPLCIVQIINEAGIFAYPLNKQGFTEKDSAEADGPMPFQVNGKWGYRDPSGKKVLIEPQYDSANLFCAGVARVAVNGKNGYIDPQGQWVVPPTLDYSQNIGEIGAPNLAKISRDGKYGIINNKGKFLVEPIYDSLGVQFQDDVIEVELKGKRGFLRIDGRVIVPPEYDDVGAFTGGFGTVCDRQKWGYVDKEGKIAIKPQYECAYGFEEDLAAVQLETKKWGFIDKTGAMAIGATYDGAGGFSEGLSSVAKGDKWGYIEKSGKTAIDFLYEHAGCFQKGQAEVILNGKPGYINKEGRFRESK